MTLVTRFLATIGRFFIAALETLGRIAIFTVTSVLHCLQPPWFLRLIGRQMLSIGYYSLPVVGLTALFTGMVLALQIYSGSSRFNAEGAVATIVVIGITRELGPVLAGLMVAGRVGAAMLPLLVLVADVIGVFGGYLVGIHKLGFNPATYLNNTVEFLEALDVISGLVKASVFGFLIALMGCYRGYHSRGGAQGVGAATTNAVVSASILILASDYLITEIFFAK